MKITNIYCDESCHLEHDGHSVMVLAAISCNVQSSQDIAKRLRSLKTKHGLSAQFELKWTKVSPAKVAYYLDVINYFFDDPALRFRALVAPKHLLDHAAFGQDHDVWYYKMYYELLKHLIKDDSRYRIYLDVKDTKSAFRQVKLREVLCNRLRDFSRTVVERVQAVHSKEVEQVQLADLLAGALSHHSRPETSDASTAKSALIRLIQERSGRPIGVSTPYGADKVNILHWLPKAVRHE